MDVMTPPNASWPQRFANHICQWDALGYTPATSGNFSANQPDSNGFWVSRSGVDKAHFTASDFIPVTPQGTSKGDAIPSAETLIHATLYQQLPHIRFIAHIHSQKLTLLSRLWLQKRALPQWIIQGYELQKAFEGQQSHLAKLIVPILDNSQTMTDITTPLTALLATPDDTQAPGFLIAGHGLYTYATSLEALARHVSAFEFLAACTLDCWNYGDDFSTP
jgi:methylthioribulose-1-phosphate dehydratase